ncbi:serine/threonine protein kinase [bacterium]|nr:serine/threonine protein kinase [bacterium]
MGLEKENKFKEMPNDGIGALGTVFALIVGFFGVIAFFVSLMVNIDENPAAAMLGGIVLLLFAATYIYFTRIRQKKGATDSANVKRLEDRMENLEALICRLDRELNQQLEQSLMLTKPGQFQGGMSQMQTSLLSVTSALEERFQILRELGHGGMGVVLQAYDKQLKEQVAIKVLSPLVGRNPEAIERLRREVSAARRVTHPNVIRIHDVSEAGGLSYISMEYFEGVNLKEYIRQNGPLSIVRAFQIMDQIADGLEEAHRNGVIHRDLKSQNVIINRANQIKIIDFGLARSQHLDGMTATGLIMGTPEYMSPEQVAGKSVDERSDIYAFGIILYELLTGRVPFTGESAISIGFKQIKDDPPTPRTFNPGIPEELERVILKALNKDPLERYHSCSELKQELQRAMQSPVRFVPPASSRQDIAELEVSGRQDAGVTKR